MREHVDDRRHLYADIFPTPGGDVNVIDLFDGTISAWHRHQHQDDYFFCVRGRVKIGIKAPGEGAVWIVLDETRRGPIVVPANAWHGYQGFSGDATLVMWATQKYDPNDEERKSIEEMGIPWVRAPR